ncbi:MAG: tRNA lysidine(34) synthetase TilS [Clostridia bacterium]|nr:tRNA lysidine(34) synthetase TilS [Clostridia bacterium]
MKNKILHTIKKYNLIENGDSIVIGVSGGPDSICLLNILNELKEELNFKIYVAHINHLIRKEADEETEYVKSFCKNIGVECFTKKIDVIGIAKELKVGTEEAGRKIRYDFFEEVLRNTNSNKIATAHNNNDKVETIIMNILRGSGISGLKGLDPIRENKFIKPLIETSREEIEHYCEENKLNPRIDKSNNENIYTRNKVRNCVIPYIKKEFNPNILKTINRLSEVATEENEYLNSVTQKTFDEICVSSVKTVESYDIREKTNNSIILDLKKFNNIELVIKRRLILYTINELLGTTEGIEKVNIDDIIKLCNNNIGNKFLKPTKNIKILVKNKKIFFTPNYDLP